MAQCARMARANCTLVEPHLSGFWRKWHRILQERPAAALRASFWRLTGRRVRAANILRDASRGLRCEYPLWLEQSLTRARALGTSDGPTITVLIHGEKNTGSALWRRSRASVERQDYAKIIRQECWSDELAAALQALTSDYVFFLRAGDELAKAALLFLVAELGERSAPIIYGDEDGLIGSASERPWFKPRWNSEMFLALDYLSSASALRTDLARQAAQDIGEQADDPLFAILLRATELAGNAVTHLPEVLVHVDRSKAEPSASRLNDVQRHLGTRARCLPGPFDTVQVQWPLPAELPLVSIVIPTRDKVELLRTCVESVRSRTTYRNYELVVVDNGSVEAATLSYLAELRATPGSRVIRSDAPYNYSALNNLAVATCSGKFVLLLNNDTEVITPEWLTEMVRYANRDDVGAVGAKLLYDDGSIQHAGVVVGMGEAAGHAHRFLRVDDPGYFRQAHAAQFVSAVTAACLLVDRGKYMAVGGLDEQNLAIAYNDVDFCLKLQRAGWRNVYTPHAALYHHESKSRGDDLSPEHRARYMRELAVLQERWATRTFVDPLHSVNLDRYSETYIPNLG